MSWTWLELTKAWRYGDLHFFVFGSWLTHFVVFWGVNGVLALVYHYNLFPQYKIQPASKWPSRELVWDCVRDRLTNQFFSQPIGLYLLYYVIRWTGLEIHSPVPSCWTFLWQCTFFFLLNDALFYWVHRALHHPSIYGLIHKRHHMFKQSIGIAAEYAHPVEDLCANIIPTLLGPVLIPTHLAVFWVYISLRVWETLDAHSGYMFPWSPWCLIEAVQGGAQRHDWHHSHGHKNGNFGMLRIWDWLCGTDQAYNEWVAKGRRYGPEKGPSAAPIDSAMEQDAVSPRHHKLESPTNTRARAAGKRESIARQSKVDESPDAASGSESEWENVQIPLTQ